MLSCLVPPRFGQEDKIMPSSTAFSLQFPSLASSLHHHNSNKDDDSTSTQHADYVIECPKCHQRLPGFQALRDHYETEHPTEKHFDSSPNYHQNNFNNNCSNSNNSNINNNNNNTNYNNSSSSNNSNNSNNSKNNSGISEKRIHNHNSRHSMIPGTPSPPISTTPIVGGSTVGATDLSTSGGHSGGNHHLNHHHHHHHPHQSQPPPHPAHHNRPYHHHPSHEVQQCLQQQQHAMAMAMAAGLPSVSPPNPQSYNGYKDEGGRSTSSPSSSTTLGDIFSTAMLGPGGPHACGQCSAAYPTRDLLEKHELMHSPNTTVSCKVCHKTFANVYRLQRHMISHDESALLRKFKCNECDKAFKFKHHLKEHVRIHSGEKPFACDNCGKRFSHSGSYSSHMTSKKCISMGLKLNNNRSMMKSLEKGAGPLSLAGQTSKRLNALAANPMSYFPPGLPNVPLPGALNNNNSATSPNNNAFYPLPFPKYNNYEVMLLASLQHPFYSMALDPRIHPYSIHRLLELTAPGNSHNMDLLKNCDTMKNGSVKTPSLHSDPEDMIEEVTEDVGDEPKLVMDLETGAPKVSSAEKYDKSPASSPMNNDSTYDLFSEKTTENAEDDVDQRESDDAVKEEKIVLKEEPDEENDAHVQPEPDQRDSPEIKVEENADEDSKESLQCGRCDKKFNHQTELVQHEKVLCGLLNQRPPTSDAEPINSSYFQSGSEEDAEDRESKNGSESERKVRVRTAITEEQQTVLKEHYAMNARPSREEFRLIAGRLNLDPRVVQVWFQNNRSRERKLNNYNLGSKNFASPHINQSTSPAYSPSVRTGNTTEDQPLDLSVKKEAAAAAQSPRYGTAPLQTDINEAINLSIKMSRSPTPYRFAPMYNASAPQFRAAGETSSLIRQTPSPNEAVPRNQPNPYMLPGGRGLPMECLLQMTPELARNQFLGLKLGERGTSLSPGSERRSWRDDESRISHDDEYMHSGKRLKLESNGANSTDIECPFVCDQCDKAFSKQSSLARHKYEHSGQRPYKCEECPKAFKHKHHLTEHKRLHSGEKPFQCTKCLKRFSHSGSYSQHMNHRYSYCKPYRE